MVKYDSETKTRKTLQTFPNWKTTARRVYIELVTWWTLIINGSFRKSSPPLCRIRTIIVLPFCVIFQGISLGCKGDKRTKLITHE